MAAENQNQEEEKHIPVLLEETMDYMKIYSGGVYVDATLGRGGHTKEILSRLGPDGGLIIGVDRDRESIDYCQKNIDDSRLVIHHANFTDLESILKKEGISGADGILFDLGVSSPQLEDPERGFTYSKNAPLDMRMDRNQRITAETIINEYDRDQIKKILQDYGEERWAHRIANFICKRRKSRRITQTAELVDIIKNAIPAGARRKGGHPARRTFQALRLAVNEELESLEKAISLLPSVLNSGGRVCVISFHSLEDRIVKHKFRDFARECECPPDLPVCRCDTVKKFKILTGSPVTPENKEIEKNPRARSAKLRAAERI